MEVKSPNQSRIEARIGQLKEQPDKPYMIRYQIESGRFGRDEVNDKQGLTQDLIYISCITNPDGSYSQIWHGIDGATDGPMHHDDVFKAWILMASSLREKDDLDPTKRDFVDAVFEAWRQAILATA